MSRNVHVATETLTVEQNVASLPTHRMWARAVFERIGRVVPIPRDARVLDVGAVAGAFLVACAELGYRCEGIEPWEDARRNAGAFANRMGARVNIGPGTAEAIPYDAESFDVVHASGVIEHVLDVDRAFQEINRVLKRGGVFWFNAASAMCPRQDEIRVLPLFGWYPDPLKRKIMNWAKDAQPHWVGHTRAPAINWFTPSKARALLTKHGFGRVYDRWDLRGSSEGGALHGMALRVMRVIPASKVLADVVVPGCSFAAVK
jgi:ubiquinone/menaquinone biosynthesis C-methylase UbiE